MVSTFAGLEVAKRALATSQIAIATTGHNIANANTEGYSRQRVSIATTEAFPTVGTNAPVMPGQLGTGVVAAQILRIRDSFVDAQYRTETSKLGYWESRSELLSQMEDVMNEPSDTTGLANVMNSFWESLEDVTGEAQNEGARLVISERGAALADTFNYYASSLKAVQQDYRTQVDQSETTINSKLRQINQLNQQIGAIEPNGYIPNDLYDARDKLVDELSEMVNIVVEKKTSGGLSAANAEGLYDVYLATPEGNKLKDASGNEIKLVDATTKTATGIHFQYEDRTKQDSPVTSIRFFELNDYEDGFKNLATATDADTAATAKYTLTSFSDFNSQGNIKAYIEGYGYKDSSGNTKGLYNDMLSDLDTLAFTFATRFNEVHQAGWSLNDIKNGTQAHNDFFSLPVTKEGAASKIALSDAIKNDVSNFAGATTSTSGNGTNALKLAAVKDEPLNYSTTPTNAGSYYQGIIAKLGEKAAEANRMVSTAETLQSTVDDRRKSISSVSIDEEMVDLIKFQQAYNSSARMITVMDEMLDKIINGMGVGGR